MKNKNEILIKVKEIIEEVTLESHRASDISNDAKIIDDLGLDSLDYAQVFLGCEIWLGQKLKEENIDWSVTQTVGELSEMIFRNSRSC